MAQKSNAAAASKRTADSTEYRPAQSGNKASGNTRKAPGSSSGVKKTGSSSGAKKGGSSSGAKKTGSSSGKKRSASSSGNRNTGSTSGGRRKQTPVSGKGYAMFRESFLWLMILFSVLLTISNFGFGGSIGEAVSSVFFGLMGWLSYLFPFAALFEIFFAIANEGNHSESHRVLVKILGGVLLFLFLCLFASLLQYGNTLIDPFDAYASCYQNHNGGGFVGAFLSWGLIPSFGIAGAYAIDIIFIIISMVMLTGKSALRSINRFFIGIGQGIRESYAEFAASRDAYRENSSFEEEYDTNSELSDWSDHETKAKIAISHRNFATQTQTVSGIKPAGKEKEPFSSLPSEETAEPLTAADPLLQKLKSDVQRQGLKEQPSSNENPLSPENLSPEFSEKITPASGMKELLPEEKPAEEEALSPSASRRKSKKAKTPLSDADKQHGIDDVQRTINADAAKEAEEETRDYVFPTLQLMDPGKGDSGNHTSELYETARKLSETLHNFGVEAKVTDYSRGPAVTRFEITPAIGVKVSKIVSLADDIKLNLAAADIRIEAPIPGKSAVGIEVPNAESSTVPLRALLESDDFQRSPSKVSFAVGRDIAGKVKIANIAKMPHLLIAGATGSGKSVCINTIIMSILYKAKPDEVKLIMIDPKVVELSVYNGIPHLLIPVVTDPKKAAGSLNWAVNEMTDRYQKFAESGVRDINGYNERILQIEVPEGQERPAKMPLIVIIVDELADLMMVASKDVEEAICRLAQLARAAGIHLIIATQRPSVNVITGLIKANMPSRIAFAVTSGVDSRTILDMNGAEKLLGKGDMLFDPQGAPKPLRIQGAFVSDDEVARVVKFIKENNSPAEHDPEVEKRIASVQSASSPAASAESDEGRDPYFADAGKIITDKEKASIGMLQRFLKIGFNRAARIMDQLEEAGVVGPEEGTKPRAVLMTPEQFENYLEENG